MKTAILAMTAAAGLAGFASAAAAGTNDYGGYDIVEDASMSASGYGKARGWQVMAAFQGTKFAFCYAEPESEPADSRARIGWDAQQWQAAVPLRARKDWEGTLSVDGRGGGNGGGTQASGTVAGGRTIVWLQLGDVELMRNGQTATVVIGRQNYRFSLVGAAAAMLKIEECVQRRGRVTSQGASQVTAPAAQAQPPARLPAQPAPMTAPTSGAAASSLHKRSLGQVGGWELTRYTTDRAGRNLDHCEAKIYTGTERGMRFVVRANSQAYGFSGYGSSAVGNSVPLKVWLDGDRSSAATDTARLEADSDTAEWLMVSEGNDSPGMFSDGLGNGRSISFGYTLDRRVHVETFSLKSSNQVIDRLFDCRDGR